MKTLVLVGGVPAEREVMTAQLEARGFSVAPPCATGAALLETRGPRIAIIDAALPDMSAAQLMAELQKRRSNLALVFEVGAEQLELAVSLMRGGAADVLVRNAEHDALTRALERLLSNGNSDDDRQHIARARLGALTPRELEVVLLATAGLGNKEVGNKLSISYRTVELHRRHAMRKLGTANIVELTHLLHTAGHDQANPEVPPSRELTGREREIQGLTDLGLSAKDIAARLSISTRTVETHRGNVLRKHHLAAETPSAPWVPRPPTSEPNTQALPPG